MMVLRSKSLTCIAALLVTAALAPISAGADRRGDPERHRDRNQDRDRDRDRHPDRRHSGPNIIIEPEIDLSRRRKPDVDAPEFVMAEVEACANAGVWLFVDCLRVNHSSVMIRRLEACLRSETIPDDPSRILACLPPARLR